MDAPGASSPPGGNQEPQRTAASAAYAHSNPASSSAGVFPVGAVGAMDLNQVASALFNPYAAAVAAIAAANQHIAQSHIAASVKPTQGGVPQSTNPHSLANSTNTGIPAHHFSSPQGKVNDAQINSSTGNEQHPSTGVQAIQNAGAPNQTQLNQFVFPPNFAAFLGGGFTNHASAPQNNRQLPPTTHHSNNTHAAASNQPTAPTPSTMAPPASIPSMPRTPAAVAAAAAQVVAAHAAAASSGHVANALFANMQHWKLNQLESHVQLLRDTNQPIPQPVALLLADARRREDKRSAKRVANRKSACSSRARKKALVEEMTKANARLRRQAMILALLPDLVITITVDGEVTFCSAQVERVLRHQVDHLVGANIADILTPSSRDKLQQLIEELLAAEKAAAVDDDAVVEQEEDQAKAGVNENENQSAESSAGREISSRGEAVIVSEQSFPLSVVKVNSQLTPEENSDLSASNGEGKLAAAKSRSSRGHCRDGEATTPHGNAAERTVGTSDATQVKSDVSSSNPTVQAQSSDDSLCSSNDAKNLRKANEALGRNVRWHNAKLASKKKLDKAKSEHKDDVIGAFVTANNADARLSSLQHRTDSSIMDKESVDATSDDSGYRESSDSLREDTYSSSSEETSSYPNGPRPKPLAPACNICLIRDDLTTIWCEVTSSIRTRSLKAETGEGPGGFGEELAAAILPKMMSSNVTQSGDGSKTSEEDPAAKDEVKELLLCLRPIHDGQERVDESLRFVPPKAVSDPATITDSTGGAYTSTGSSDGGAKDPETGNFVLSTGKEQSKHRPPKKRPIVGDASLTRISCVSLSNDSGPKPAKKRRVNEEEPEKNAVESLMLMGNKAA